MSTRRDHSLQFKITLKGLRPPIWRRILIPSTYTFWDLHVAIQDAIGWLDCHLHEFHIGSPVDGTRTKIGIPLEEPFARNQEVVPGWTVPVTSYFTLSNRRADYLYDFGDAWQHTVELEQIAPLEDSTTLPACLSGRRRCPPEDCGGAIGYERLLKILQDPSHGEHADVLDWLGGSFVPEDFDKTAVRFDDPTKRWQLAFAQGQDPS